MALMFVTLRTMLAMLATSQWVVFSQRIANYMELRERAVREVGEPPDTADAVVISRNNTVLANRIMSLRSNASELYILRPPVADQLRAALGRRLAGSDRELLLAVIRDVQPEAFLPIVNTPYPEDEPLPSTPTALLRVLPDLPRQLTYRFVGRDLLLLDRDTRVILDVLRDALPPR